VIGSYHPRHPFSNQTYILLPTTHLPSFIFASPMVATPSC